jgi:hypothetical protein
MWWYLIIMPLAVLTGRLMRRAWIEGYVEGIDPPRERRLRLRPTPRGFPVVLPAPARGVEGNGGAGSAVGAEAIAAGHIPVAVEVRSEGMVRAGDDPREANPVVVEAALQVGELALELAEAASDCYREIREAHESVRTPLPAAPRPETAVEAVMELRRRREAAAARTPAVE